MKEKRNKYIAPLIHVYDVESVQLLDYSIIDATKGGYTSEDENPFSSSNGAKPWKTWESWE